MNGLDDLLDGLARARDNFDRVAEKIAASPTVNPKPEDQASLSDDMVNLMEARNDYEANLKSLKVGNEMTKKLLDILG